MINKQYIETIIEDYESTINKISVCNNVYQLRYEKKVKFLQINKGKKLKRYINTFKKL